MNCCWSVVVDVGWRCGGWWTESGGGVGWPGGVLAGGGGGGVGRAGGRSRPSSTSSWSPRWLLPPRVGTRAGLVVSGPRCAASGRTAGAGPRSGPIGPLKGLKICRRRGLSQVLVRAGAGCERSALK